MIWVAQFSIVCLLAWMLGAWAARRAPVFAASKRFHIAALVFLLLAVWFGLSWWARQYGATDRPGWQWAEAWAHTGKWYALLAGVLFGARVAAASADTKRFRLLGAVCVLLAAVVGWQTMPVYFVLGEGARDDHGYLRQSPDVESTCGGVALANYLEQFRQQRVSEREISRMCRTTREGSTEANVLRAARSFGLTNAVARQLTWPELRDLRRPVIVSISTVPGMLHATLLVEVTDTEAVFIDPAYGRWVVTPERMREIWRGKTIVLD